MPRVDIAFEEQSPDFREREVSLKLNIKNTGGTPIEILAVSPRIPEGAVLLETKDFSLLAKKATHAELCAQLTNLAKDVLISTDETLRNRLTQLQKEALERTLSEISGWFGLWRLYLHAFKGTLLQRFEEAKRKEEALFVKIESSEDARRVLADIVEPSDTDQALKKAFTFKIDKLADLEGVLGQGADLEAAPIATVEPDSFFTATYIVRFPRNWLNPSRFSVSVETTYREQGKPERHNGMTTAAIHISPNPFVLTMIAMASALLGVALKNVVPAAAAVGSRLELAAILPMPDLIAGLILALVFFNAFEFTDVLKDMRKSLGWRSAMLIGMLCGLGSDRIFASVKVLTGA